MPTAGLIVSMSITIYYIIYYIIRRPTCRWFLDLAVTTPTSSETANTLLAVVNLIVYRLM